MNENVGAFGASVVVFAIEDGSDVGNLKPVDAGATIDAVRDAGGESVISIESSSSCGTAEAGATGEGSFLGTSSAAVEG